MNSGAVVVTCPHCGVQCQIPPSASELFECGHCGRQMRVNGAANRQQSAFQMPPMPSMRGMPEMGMPQGGLAGVAAAAASAASAATNAATNAAQAAVDQARDASGVDGRNDQLRLAMPHGLFSDEH